MHAACWDFVAETADYLDPQVHRSFLEVGALDVNGSIRHFFGWAEVYDGLDIVDGPGVDIVADARTWIPPGTYDVVVSTEVLEHVADWGAIVQTCMNALR